MEVGKAEVNATPAADEAIYNRTRDVLIDLLVRNQGTVSTLILRKRLESKGVLRDSEVIARQKYQDSGLPDENWAERSGGELSYRVGNRVINGG